MVKWAIFWISVVLLLILSANEPVERSNGILLCLASIVLAAICMFLEKKIARAVWAVGYVSLTLIELFLTQLSDFILWTLMFIVATTLTGITVVIRIREQLTCKGG